MSLNSGQGVGLEKITSLPRGGGGRGVLQISSCGGGRRTVLGLTFSIVRYFFRLRKFGNFFFFWVACFMVVSAYRGCKTQTFNF